MIVPVEGSVTVRLYVDTDTGTVVGAPAFPTDGRHAWAPPDGLAMPDDWTVETYAEAAAAAVDGLTVEAVI